MKLHAFACAALLSVSACGQPPTGSTPSAASDQDVDLRVAHVGLAPVATPDAVKRALASGHRSLGHALVDGTPVDPAAALDLARDVFNLGKDEFDFLKENRGTVNIATDFAEAIPRSATAMTLSDWSEPQMQSYHFTAENALGMTLMDTTLTVVYQYGGRFHGLGHYLTNVSVYPSDVWTFWAVDVAGDVTAGAATNVGSDADPVAGLVLQVHLHTQTPINATESGMTCTFRGDSGQAACS